MKTNINSKVLATVLTTLVALPGAAFAAETVNGKATAQAATVHRVQGYEGQAGTRFNLIDGQPVR